jgi:hypothetical protein
MTNSKYRIHSHLFDLRHKSSILCFDVFFHNTLKNTNFSLFEFYFNWRTSNRLYSIWGIWKKAQISKWRIENMFIFHKQYFVSSISNKLFFVAKNLFHLCGLNSFRLDLIIKLIWFFSKHNYLSQTVWWERLTGIHRLQLIKLVWQSDKIDRFQFHKKRQKVRKFGTKAKEKDRRKIVKLCFMAVYLIQFQFWFNFVFVFLLHNREIWH